MFQGCRDIQGCSQDPKTSRMESFATVVNNLKPLIIAANLWILDLWGDPDYANDIPGKIGYFSCVSSVLNIT